ncbi:MAG: hypothetical protein K0U98_01385 [Deltaproteobacteria bacterium]|nr:hypothetical protein [Deltaproteobacteria bacterium]
MNLDTKEKFLRIALIVFGLVFSVGLLPMTILFPDSWMWEPRHKEYEQMILAIYAVLGIFLVMAAKEPAQHRSLISFTAWSSLVHGGVMLLQALRDPTEHANLCGDVPALFAVGFVFLWLGPRKPTSVTVH